MSGSSFRGRLPVLGCMLEHALEEELANLLCHTWHASTALALGGASRWDALWYDQQGKEKCQLEENVYNLTLK